MISHKKRLYHRTISFWCIHSHTTVIIDAVCYRFLLLDLVFEREVFFEALFLGMVNF